MSHTSNSLVSVPEPFPFPLFPWLPFFAVLRSPLSLLILITGFYCSNLFLLFLDFIGVSLSPLYCRILLVFFRFDSLALLAFYFPLIILISLVAELFLSFRYVLFFSRLTHVCIKNSEKPPYLLYIVFFPVAILLHFAALNNPNPLYWLLVEKPSFSSPLFVMLFPSLQWSGTVFNYM